MSHFARFIEQIKILYALVTLQKILRLFVRAFWLGSAGVLAGWAVHTLSGWLPNPITWVALGLGFALVPLVGIVLALNEILLDLPPPAAWIGSLDRRLHQRQQLSTAWEVAQEKRTVGLVADLLVEDVLALFPRAREPILKGGWFPKADLAAAGLMILLSCVLLAALLQPAPLQAGPAHPQAVPNTVPQPPAGQDPAAEQQPPAGPGDQAGESPDEQDGTSGQGVDDPNQAQGEPAPDPGAAAGDLQNDAAVAEALRQMGSELSRQAGTYDLGQALENLEMNSAADALDELGSQMEDLSPETRENLANALEDAANSLDQANAPQLSQDMQDASEALQDPEASPEQPLDELENDLREMESEMQAFQGGSGAAGEGSSSEGGLAEPADRLLNENGLMEIPQENTDPSGLLSPARPDAEGEGTASGSLDASGPQQLPAGQSPLLPNSFLWKWRNVVSEYFQR